MNILTYPVPVILIHGLWGGRTSLASAQLYLQTATPLRISPIFVSPICYSIYLAYYAAVDTLPGAGSSQGCETTSAQAISTYLAGLYQELDDSQIVGGRVDAVAHSMGGLAIRNYANQNAQYDINGASVNYSNPRNRNQGTFRDIVTLDTPETGSELAYYLDNTFAMRTESDGTSVLSDQLWKFFCKDFLGNKTVQQCLNDNHMPLMYPGHATSEGAVYSLIPDSYIGKITSFSHGGAQFNDLVDPNITNAKWFAVAGYYLDNGESPQPLVRDFLNKFIAATYPTNTLGASYSMTLEEMFQDPVNDVIVTVNSQLYEAKAGQFREFQNLAHTSIPGLGGVALKFFTGDSNAAVTNSTNVDQQVAHWLGYM